MNFRNTEREFNLADDLSKMEMVRLASVVLHRGKSESGKLAGPDGHLRSCAEERVGFDKLGQEEPLMLQQ